jgi:branched-chain amino acid transport system substrate-binding protein
LRTYRRAGYAGAIAIAAGALAIAGCSSSSSSSSSTTAPSSAAATSAPSSASSSASAAPTGTTASGTSVTNYLSYVGGKAGAADASLPPVTIGYMNEQGDANPPGPLATVGAEMAVKYINAELGGVGGHPLKLDTCFVTEEQQGTSCADQFLASKSTIPLVATGGVAVGAQSFFNTMAGQMPVIDGVAVTPFDAVAKNAFILFGDSTHVLGPIGTYAQQIHAKTATVIYPENPGIIPGAMAIQAGLKAAGVTVSMEGYPQTATSLTQYLVAGHATSADMVVPYADAASCVNLAKGLTALHITDPTKIVSAPLCLSGTVIQGLGDFPKWTYSIASSNYGDPTDAGMPAYEAVTKKYTTVGDAVDPWVIVNFGEILTVDKLLNQIGYGKITPAAVEAAAAAFKGPQALGAPALDCGQFASAPAVCNDRVQFFEYAGKNVFKKVASWLQPVS